MPGLRATETAFTGFDESDQQIQSEGFVMHTVPRFLRGVFKRPLLVGGDLRHTVDDVRGQERGWELFLHVSRM